MGPHHGYIFIGRASSQYPQIIIHEMLHGLGFAMPCTKGVKDGAHISSGMFGTGWRITTSTKHFMVMMIQHVQI